VQQPILIVEDDRKIARLIMAYLEGAGFRVLHAETGKDALAKASAEIPLAVILDLNLPDMGGEEICQELKEQGDIPIIMLTAKSSEEERIAGFALGADDYVVKPASPRELVWRVKAVLKRTERRAAAGKPLSFNNGKLVLDGQRFEVHKAGHSVSLTPTEFKLLFLLATSQQKTFSREELVNKALGYQFDGYERSIDAHIKNLRQKIEDDSRNPEFIRTVYGVGYLFAGAPDA
jgi:DNA-binding response OmpR family regulator